MRRFRLRSLMGRVVPVALGFTAIRHANDLWAGGLLLITPLILGAALIGGLCGREVTRAGWLGFSLLGGIYFSLVFVGLDEAHVNRLPTSRLHRLVLERVLGFATVPLIGTNEFPSLPGLGPNIESSQSGKPRSPMILGSGPNNFYLPGTSPNRWLTMLPGVVNYEAFQIVGHCLFALVIGGFGAIMAGQFAKHRDAASERSPRAVQ